ncbi:hypothetical protein [Perlabentimonas gracilis]|uniref:hypothetical protein n=1 Tax=Perlabentimonas gracilis TaxID=2715279 RepID=UPI0014082E50|nr:hypothetical protein [Perlabentimonas gracilis]NHB68832.1 hypothetical protein [Perlabentimonas gracilis]
MKDNSDYYQWDRIKSKLSQMYPSLTPADLTWRYGTKTDLIEMIASKLGKTTQDLQAEVDNH